MSRIYFPMDEPIKPNEGILSRSLPFSQEPRLVRFLFYAIIVSLHFSAFSARFALKRFILYPSFLISNTTD